MQNYTGLDLSAEVIKSISEYHFVIVKVSIFFSKGLKIHQKSAQQNRRSQNVSDVQVL